MEKKVLGRGLSALLKEELVPIQKTQDESKLNIELITPNKNQPRRHFDPYKIDELAESIGKHGVLQPIIVQKISDQHFEIIAGERRFRAAQKLGLKELPVIIRDFTQQQGLEVALIENIQRQELNVLEEAEAYQRLISEFQYSQQQVAESVGKSRSHITNLLRINQLDNEIKALIIGGKLSMGHARCLVGHPEALQLAWRVVQESMSVRQLEQLIAHGKKGNSTIGTTLPKNSKAQHNDVDNDQTALNQDDDLALLARSLSDKFKVKVTIENSNNTGKISFHFNNLEELDSILTKID